VRGNVPRAYNGVMEEGVGQPVSGAARQAGKRWLMAGGIVLLGVLLSAGVVLKRVSTHTATLLPAAVSQKAQGFTAYFYAKAIPEGYRLDTAHISTDAGVIIMPLTKPEYPTIVLTEQALPDNADQLGLQDNGQKVAGTLAPATINDVEGRLVGVMIVRETKTLILLNAPGNGNRADMAALLQGLRPVR